LTGLKERVFTVMLTPEDRYRHSHIRFRGEVVSFTIQYETKVEGRWYPVVRFDTEHGFAHRDLLDKKGHRQKTPLFTRDYNEALTFAEFDVKTNWRNYKKAFRGGDGYEGGS
jgi:hypothetical protein